MGTEIEPREPTEPREGLTKKDTIFSLKMAKSPALPALNAAQFPMASLSPLRRYVLRLRSRHHHPVRQRPLLHQAAQRGGVRGQRRGGGGRALRRGGRHRRRRGDGRRQQRAHYHRECVSLCLCFSVSLSLCLSICLSLSPLSLSLSPSPHFLSLSVCLSLPVSACLSLSCLSLSLSHLNSELTLLIVEPLCGRDAADNHYCE